MVRTLRFQLLAIVVGTVLAVFAASRWVDAQLADHALRRDIEERALSALRTVDFFWDRAEPRVLSHVLDVLVRSNGPLLGITIYAPHGLDLDASSRSGVGMPPEPSRAARRLVESPAGERTVASDRADDVWHVALALRRDGALVGVAEATLSPREAVALHDRLRTMDLGALAVAVLATSLLIGLFIERRVTRPVESLVVGMRRAEGGERGVRVTAGGTTEFRFLADAFNRMLERLEELAGDLEVRVARATRDLAERNRQLAETNGRLWRAQLDVVRGERFAALGQMAATIAHELGTPLNSVLGYTQLLRREELPPAQAARLQIVESQVQRMIETIRSVLDRMRQGTAPRVEVALAPLVTEVLELVATRLAERRLVAVGEVGDDVPPVEGDPVALRQVLRNLVTNAIDATPAGGRIEVRAERVDDAGAGAGSVAIVVRDTGVGMAAADVRRIFEPFYTTKGPERGSGLGLAIVEHVARSHGGRVVVESAPGRGTTMRVLLPAAIRRKATA
ncbi:MAG: HAMP domain-containing histidine kinase [bacterium]|nr:HAMP domain-containing histidine kinase [bacterium]